MPVSVVFPKVNLEKTSGEISSWSVSEGDEVSHGDTLFEVEDDKATVEIDSAESGYIGGLASVGEEIDVGAVVATVYETREALEAAKATLTADNPPAAPATTAPVTGDASAPVATAPRPVCSGSVNPTPLARRIARDNGLTIEGIKGTGPRGRIQKRDVIAELERIAQAPAQPLTVAPPTTATRLNAVWYQRGEGLPVAFLHGFGADYTKAAII